MKDTRLLDKFNEVKQILCKYGYYIPYTENRFPNGGQKLESGGEEK